MKLGTVSVNGAQRVAVKVHGDRAVVLYPSLTVPDLIEDWPAARDAVDRAVTHGAHKAVPVGELTWLPPVPRPGKVICVALNNSANADRIMSGPGTPATFNKPATSLLGHGQPIRLKKQFGRVHPEPELAVVIGPGGADIHRDDAMGHVFGYTIINDLTSPTMRAEDTFHYRAIHPKQDGTAGIEYVDTWVSYSGRYKGSDGFGPIGPWIATADEIGDPHDLIVSCAHRGRVITEDSTANLTHKVADVISYMSCYQTLEPGDIIAMGTALKASSAGGAVQNVNLTELGGPIEVTISGIGTLSNPVEVRVMDPVETALLRVLVDVVLADWAWHLDHGDYAAVAALFTEDALFVTGAVELRGRPAIEHRYTEREQVRTTRHTYSGLRVRVADEDYRTDTDEPPARVRAQSTWVSYAVNGPAPVDDVGVYLVADFHDVLTWCADERYRMSERRIVPVFRDPSRAPA